MIFLSSNRMNYPGKKITKCTLIYPAFLGYITHTFYNDQFINKTRGRSENIGYYRILIAIQLKTTHTHSRPKRIPRSYQSLKNTPFSWILDEKNTPFSTQIAYFEAQ